MDVLFILTLMIFIVLFIFGFCAGCYILILVIFNNTAVRKFKIFVILVLIVAAVTVTVLVYKFSSNSEQQTLQLEYNDYAAKFFTNFYHLNVMRQWSGYTVAGMFTAQCINGYGPVNRPWPNITLPDFPNQVRGALVLGT